MNPWQYWWPQAFRAPWSGDVAQSILSPQLEVNFAGSRGIEAEVVADVASYGRQLGWLIEAVLALHPDNQAPQVVKLRELRAEVERVKARHRGDLTAEAKRALDRLGADDPEALTRLVRSYAPPP